MAGRQRRTAFASPHWSKPAAKNGLMKLDQRPFNCNMSRSGSSFFYQLVCPSHSKFLREYLSYYGRSKTENSSISRNLGQETANRKKRRRMNLFKVQTFACDCMLARSKNLFANDTASNTKPRHYFSFFFPPLEKLETSDRDRQARCRYPQV